VNAAGLFVSGGGTLRFNESLTGYASGSLFSAGGTSNTVIDLGLQARLAPQISGQIGYISFTGSSAPYLGVTIHLHDHARGRTPRRSRSAVGTEGGVHQFRFLQGVRDMGRPSWMPSLATSLEHSRQATSRHSSGKRLFELAEIVIDTQAPFGDAILEIDGPPQRVAAVSTSLACAVINALVADTAARLVAQGQRPLVIGHIDREGRAIPHELREQYRREFLSCLWCR